MGLLWFARFDVCGFDGERLGLVAWMMLGLLGAGSRNAVIARAANCEGCEPRLEVNVK
jgi:hypothetical protein